MSPILKADNDPSLRHQRRTTGHFGRCRVCAWVALASAILVAQGRSQNIVRPENQPVSLTGTIRLVHGFGPPGYGETPKQDAKVTYWAIETIRPVMATPNSGDFDCVATNRLKLFFREVQPQPLSRQPAALWQGHHVTIRGKIHCADTAGEMTPIYMDVDYIEPATTKTKRRND
jgi:hypothetical protein